MGGVFKEITVPERLVCTERFDQPWYEGDALNTTSFVEQAGQTTVTMTVRYQSKEIRDSVLRSPMESGVAESFDLLDQPSSSLVLERRGDGLRRALGLDADLLQHSPRGELESAEVEPGAYLAGRAREALGVAELGRGREELLQGRSIAGGEHHGVEGLGRPVLEDGRRLGEALDPGDYLHLAPSHQGERADVDQRDAAIALDLLQRPIGSPPQSELGDVADGQCEERRGQGIGDPGGEGAEDGSDTQDREARAPGMTHWAPDGEVGARAARGGRWRSPHRVTSPTTSTSLPFHAAPFR